MNEPSRQLIGIAVVDDDDVYRAYVTALLAKRSDFIVYAAASGPELYKLLADHRVDCIVLDYNLGLETGFAIKEQLTRRYLTPPPVIMLTGAGSERTVIKALRLGISDYVPKADLDAAELVSVILRAVAQDRQGQATKADHRRLTEASGLDTQTSLFGRSHLDESLMQLAALTAKAREAYGSVLVELPEWARINETFGLAAGTQALRAFADKLRGLVRSSDVCGRYADNLFLCIIETRGELDYLTDFARRLTAGLSFRIELDRSSLDLSARIGGAMCGAGGAYRPEDLVGRALKALQEAKAAGASFHIAPAAAIATSPSCRSPEGVSRGPAVASSPAGDRLRATDRRTEPRHRVLKRGQIILVALNSAVDCTIRSTSTRGAGLRVGASFAVPENIDLLVIGTGERRPVRVRWQVGCDLGVEYID